MNLAREALQAIPLISLSKAFWYVLFASGVWLSFYVVFRHPMRSRKIASRFPTWRQMGWEVLYSLRSLLIFGIVGGFMYFCTHSGWSRFYRRIEDLGWGWFLL